MSKRLPPPLPRLALAGCAVVFFGLFAKAYEIVDITQVLREETGELTSANNVVFHNDFLTIDSTGSAAVQNNAFVSHAFDGDTTTTKDAWPSQWVIGNKPAIVQYIISDDWRVGTEVILTSYRVYYAGTDRPGTWTLSGSNDGGETWTELSSRSGSWSGDYLEVEIPEEKQQSYRAYKYHCTANADSGGWVRFAEIEFYGYVITPDGEVTISATGGDDCEIIGITADGVSIEPGDEVEIGSEIVISANAPANTRIVWSKTPMNAVAGHDPQTGYFTLSFTAQYNVAPVASTVTAPPDGLFSMPGLLGGYLSGVTSVMAGTYPSEESVYFSPEAAASTASPPWAANRTWVYHGQMRFAKNGVYWFGENIDDVAWLKVDGNVILNNSGWNTPTYGYVIVEDAPCWRDFEARFYNSGSGAGAVAGSGWTTTKGFGYFYNSDITATTAAGHGDGTAFIFPVEPGDKSLFRYASKNALEDDDTAIVVDGAPGQYGEVLPAYGSSADYESGTVYACRATKTVWTNAEETVAARLAGYSLYNVDIKTQETGETTTVGGGASVATITPTAGSASFLTWNWDSEYKITTGFANDQSYGCTLKIFANGDLVPEGSFVPAGSQIRIALDGSSAYSPGGWSGTLQDGTDIAQAELTFTLTQPIHAIAHLISSDLEVGLTRYVSVDSGDDVNSGTVAPLPKRTIASALAAVTETMAEIDATAGEGTPPAQGTIVLLPGTYQCSLAISIPANVTIRGADADDPESVKLIGVSGIGNYCVRLEGAGATLENVCVTQSKRGAIYGAVAGGVVNNCVIKDNLNDNNTISGTVNFEKTTTMRDCRIFNNYLQCSGGWGATGGALRMNSSSLVENCVITNNILSGGQPSRGCAIFINSGSAVIRNCLIARNHYNSTGTATKFCGAIYIAGGSPLLENCTITENDSPSTPKYGDASSGNSGVYLANGSATLRNCIIWGNTNLRSAANGWNLGATKPANLTIENCCYPTDNEVFNSYIEGANIIDCVHTAPTFADVENGFYGLKPCECIDGGAEVDWAENALDLGGNQRVLGDSIDIGCYEYAAEELECSFALVGSGTAVGDIEVTFRATVSAPAASLEGLTYFWDFGDGATLSGANLAEVTHTYTSRGVFDVSMRVENALGESAEMEHASLVRSVPQTLYISQSSTPCFPYDTIENAASSLVDALELALDGCTVLVDAGTWKRSKNEIIHVQKAVEIKSIYGASETIVSNTVAASNSAEQILQIDNSSAIIDGITFQKGAGRPGQSGAIYCTSGGTIRNCVFEECQAYSSGGNGANGGAISASGGVIENCVFRNSILADCSGGSRGFAIYVRGGSTQIRNCLITDSRRTGNNANNFAGAIYVEGAGTVTIDNCTIMNNKNASTGGSWAYSGNAGIHSATTGKTIVRNCIVRDNWNTGRDQLFNFSRSAGTLVVSNCCVNAEELVTNLTGANVIVEGCITSDPLLKNGVGGAPAIGYQLKAKSPCRNAGLLLDWMTEETRDITTVLGVENPSPRINHLAPDVGAFETPFMPPTHFLIK